MRRIRWISPLIRETWTQNILVVSASDDTQHLYFMNGSREEATNGAESEKHDAATAAVKIYEEVEGLVFAEEFNEDEQVHRIAGFRHVNGNAASDFTLSLSLEKLSPFLKAGRLFFPQFELSFAFF